MHEDDRHTTCKCGYKLKLTMACVVLFVNSKNVTAVMSVKYFKYDIKHVQATMVTDK